MVRGTSVESMGMTGYELLRLSLEAGLRGLDALFLIGIPPWSAVIYQLIVSVIMYRLEGRVHSEELLGVQPASIFLARFSAIFVSSR